MDDLPTMAGALAVRVDGNVLKLIDPQTGANCGDITRYCSTVDHTDAWWVWADGDDESVPTRQAATEFAAQHSQRIIGLPSEWREQVTGLPQE